MFKRSDQLFSTTLRFFPNRRVFDETCTMSVTLRLLCTQTQPISEMLFLPRMVSPFATLIPEGIFLLNFSSGNLRCSFQILLKIASNYFKMFNGEYISYAFVKDSITIIDGCN